jgi:hypothetical protein
MICLQALKQTQPTAIEIAYAAAPKGVSA